MLNIRFKNKTPQLQFSQPLWVTNLQDIFSSKARSDYITVEYLKNGWWLDTDIDTIFDNRIQTELLNYRRFRGDKLDLFPFQYFDPLLYFRKEKSFFSYGDLLCNISHCNNLTKIQLTPTNLIIREKKCDNFTVRIDRDFLFLKVPLWSPYFDYPIKQLELYRLVIIDLKFVTNQSRLQAFLTSAPMASIYKFDTRMGDLTFQNVLFSKYNFRRQVLNFAFINNGDSVITTPSKYLTLTGDLQNTTEEYFDRGKNLTNLDAVFTKKRATTVCLEICQENTLDCLIVICRTRYGKIENNRKKPDYPITPLLLSSDMKIKILFSGVNTNIIRGENIQGFYFKGLKESFVIYRNKSKEDFTNFASNYMSSLLEIVTEKIKTKFVFYDNDRIYKVAAKKIFCLDQKYIFSTNLQLGFANQQKIYSQLTKMKNIKQLQELLPTNKIVEERDSHAIIELNVSLLACFPFSDWYDNRDAKSTTTAFKFASNILNYWLDTNENKMTLELWQKKHVSYDC